MKSLTISKDLTVRAFNVLSLKSLKTNLKIADTQKDVIYRAMRMIEAQTCIRFVSYIPGFHKGWITIKVSFGRLGFVLFKEFCLE